MSCADRLPRRCLRVAFINGVVGETRDIGAGQCLKCNAGLLHTGGILAASLSGLACFYDNTPTRS